MAFALKNSMKPNISQPVPAFRFSELDALRGIAVLFVLLSHYTWAYDFHFGTLSSHTFSFPGAGAFGVELFFMISGFVIFLSLNNSKKIQDFVISRFSRLYPTYWLCLALTLFVITVFPVPTVGQLSVGSILVNLTMVQGYLKVPHLDQVYWSLGIELVFYFWMAVIFAVKNKINLICFAWLLLAFAVNFIQGKLIKILISLFVLKFTPFFVMGIMFYQIKFRQQTAFTHCLLLFATALVFYNGYLDGIANPQYSLSYMQFVLISVAISIFYYISYVPFPLLANPVLRFVGRISYPLYLLHNVIGYAIIYRIKSICDIEIVYATGTAFITISLAYLVHEFWEEKSNRYVKTKLRNIFSIPSLKL